MHRPQRESGAAYPVHQGGAIERDALACIDLRLTIERRVIGIFGDQHMRDQCLGRMPFSISRSSAGAWTTSPPTPGRHTWGGGSRSP